MTTVRQRTNGDEVGVCTPMELSSVQILVVVANIQLRYRLKAKVEKVSLSTAVV